MLQKYGHIEYDISNTLNHSNALIFTSFSHMHLNFEGLIPGKVGIMLKLDPISVVRASLSLCMKETLDQCSQFVIWCPGHVRAYGPLVQPKHKNGAHIDHLQHIHHHILQFLCITYPAAKQI